MNATLTLLVNLVATWYMVGLIWMVQVVHYAMFDRVGEAEFVRYEQDHNRLITPIVAVPMLIEIASAFSLCVVAPTGIPKSWAYAGFAMVMAIWLSTVFLQVPCHARLSEGFDPATFRTLVVTNWIRTILWTARGLLVGYATWKLLDSLPPPLSSIPH